MGKYSLQHRTFPISSRVSNVFCPPGWFRYRIVYIYFEAPGLPGIGELKYCG